MEWLVNPGVAGQPPKTFRDNYDMSERHAPYEFC